MHRSGDEDGDAGVVLSYSLLQGSCQVHAARVKKGRSNEYWRKRKIKQKTENHGTEKLTGYPK